MHWTERSRFTYGDNTVSMYEAEKNSVVQITEEDYIICNATSPVSANNSDAFSVLKLNQRGPSYFISGIVENCKCKNNETIVIVVITDGRPPGSPCHRSKNDKILSLVDIAFGVLLAFEYCCGCGYCCRKLLF
ncbi:early nodulin-like protein 1 [Tanacetum coccineum]